MTHRQNPGGDLTPILMLGGLGALAYYAYTQGWLSAFFPVGTVVGTQTQTSPPAQTAPPAQNSAPAATPRPAQSSAPASWGGPSLDTIFANLLAAEQAAMSASSPDPELTCPGGTSSTPSPQLACITAAQGTAAALTAQGGAIAATAQAQANAQLALCLAQANAKPSTSSCSMPAATYDVHNWYLVYRANAGITVAPTPPDHTTVISLQNYWVWAAPLLQQSNPGLSGGFGGGFGAYWELGRQIVRQRGW